MYLTEHFGLSLGALVIWGFMMAFFFNIFLYFATPKKNLTLLLSSFILFLSYFSSDYFFSWFSTTETYLHWAVWDLVTVAILMGIWKFSNTATPSSFLYLCTGLIINCSLFLLIYYDIYILYNKEPWILWDIYSFGVNIIDFTMIVALIVDRDILGLIKLKNGIKALFKTRNLSHSL
ncbi:MULTISPECIES: hypothetical protein [unclassified Pseudoalteromonas]|uniref:hypothetical protein n=1 Tax=unclassified Pseudoalteromonas TaxID=194690 RepID=UPI000B3D0290|nr:MULTISPECIES: hypothetical protein [unclassified Pseudoalteromonas]MDN3378289.1 hypothetical protein [Pseudoalteromonas sp. APC 3893]MDN3386209.1 hypothetical protein [Pseudoalteromonas sp. APC 4017]OUS70175.1 hypothetical protein B5G52_15230 [Pseudoalteromonas sp. A601]